MDPETTNPELKSEIGDLLAGSLPPKDEGAPPAESTPPAEPAPTTPPAEGEGGTPPAAEPPSPPAEASAPPPAGEPVTPPTESSPTEPPSGEVDWKKQAEALQQQMVEMTTKLATQQAPAAPAAEAPVGTGVIEFFKTEEEVDKAFGSAAEVNKLLTGIVQKAVEQSMRAMPQLVVNTARQQASLVNAVEKFYDVNHDLTKFKPFVGYVASELQTAHPDWDAPTLFTNVEKEVRNRLNLKRPEPAAGGSPPPGTPPNAPRGPQGGGTGPAFVGQHSRARGSVGGTGVTAKEQEILDLIKS